MRRSVQRTTRSGQTIDLDRIVTALDLPHHRWTQLDAEPVAILERRQRMTARQHDDLLAVLHELLAELLEALGDVHRIADHGEVDPAGRTDIADHHRAGMQPD